MPSFLGSRRSLKASERRQPSFASRGPRAVSTPQPSDAARRVTDAHHANLVSLLLRAKAAQQYQAAAVGSHLIMEHMESTPPSPA